MSHKDHIVAHMHSIVVATPSHHLIPDLPNTLATLTKHFTSRLLQGVHTILHVSINETYAQLAHSFATLNAYFPSGISNQIHPTSPPHKHSMIPPHQMGVMHSPSHPPPHTTHHNQTLRPQPLHQDLTTPQLLML